MSMDSDAITDVLDEAPPVEDAAKADSDGGEGTEAGGIDAVLHASAGSAADGAAEAGDELSALADAFQATSDEADAELEDLAETPADRVDPRSNEPSAAAGENDEVAPEPDPAAPPKSDRPVDAGNQVAADPGPDATPLLSEDASEREQLLDRLRAVSGKVARAVARIRTLEQEHLEQARAVSEVQDELNEARAENDALRARVKELNVDLARYRENHLAHAALDEIEQNLENVGV